MVKYTIVLKKLIDSIFSIMIKHNQHLMHLIRKEN